MTTATITIRTENEDDRLSQEIWVELAAYTSEVKEVTDDLCVVMFSGEGVRDYKWQTHCIVLDVPVQHLEHVMGNLRAWLSDLCTEYKLTSISLTLGKTERITS